MRAKQLQTKHWIRLNRQMPEKSTLEVFWSRSGINNVEDETVMRTFRLEYEAQNRETK